MNPKKTSFVFPAFVSEYLGNEVEIVRGFSNDFDVFLEIVTSKYFPEFKNFSLADKQFIENELYSQVSSYVFGCSISTYLKNRGLIPNVVAGNSMGLYTALYCSGAVDFEDGILLLKKAYEFIRPKTEDNKMGMGAIVGLDLNDIEKIVNQSNCEVFIANTNGTYSFLISGEKAGIEIALGLAKKEGALFTSSVMVKSPYHTSFLKEVAMKFGHFIDEHISLKEPVISIVSSVDQQELRSATQIRDELVKNIYCSINWYASMKNMIASGTNCFVECGAGNTLSKLARFIEGDFKVYPINKIHKLLD